MSELFRTSDFVADTAGLILRYADAAIAARGRFFLALSGGNTPKPIYEKLRELAPETSRWVITFGDERCVPPEDATSNFRMADEAWLAASDAVVLRMKGELEPRLAAEEYEAQLAQFPNFRHDLVLLGMGDDGHTASLFPGTTALEERERRVAANFVEKLGVWRLTMTYPFLNEARAVMFLVKGMSKLELMETIRSGKSDFPSGRIQPTDGELLWVFGE